MATFARFSTHPQHPVLLHRSPVRLCVPSPERCSGQVVFADELWGCSVRGAGAEQHPLGTVRAANARWTAARAALGSPQPPPSKGYKQPQPWTEGERCWLRHPPGLGVLGAPELGTGQGFLYPQRAPEREKGFSAEDDPKVNLNATECQENNAQACREELR